MRSTGSMGEGNTPLLRSASISTGLYFKLENCNPSGSYKDRFVAAEIDHILKSGGRSCIATSSGNTGSALAAGCARFGVRCVIFVNADAPSGKLAQMQAHGATVVRIPDFVSKSEITQSVLCQLQQFSEQSGTALVISAFRFCPEGMAGVRAIAYELLSQARDAEHIFVPIGGGGLFSAVVTGYEESGASMPRIHAVQPERCPTVLNAMRSGETAIEPVTSTTRISGLSVPTDIDAGRALSLLRRHKGSAIGATDEEIFAAQDVLLRKEGIYAEPAGATAFAGYVKACASGLVGPRDRCVCLVTGHGFKDPASIEAAAQRSPSRVIDASRISDELPRLVEERP